MTRMTYRGAIPKPERGGRLARHRRGTALVFIPLLALMVTGCTTSTGRSANPGGSSPLESFAPSTKLTPTTPQANTVAVPACCIATLPTSWATPKLIANGLYGVSDAQGSLAATWQVIGAAHSCPLEPPKLLASLVSPTRPSGDVITAVDSIVVDGRRVTVYVSTPRAPTPRAYQHVSADAVLGARCVELGAAEYGVASASNLQALLHILSSTRPVAHPLQP
jgi:hypothetical protein